MTWLNIIHDVLPFVAAQLYLFILFYVIITKKRLGGTFVYLSLFLGAMIFFLICYQLDGWDLEVHVAKLIHLRLTVLIGIGFPSLTIALSRFSEVYFSRWQKIGVYGAGLLLALLTIFFNCLAWRSSFGNTSLYFTDYFPGFQYGRFFSQFFASLSAVALILVPCGILVFSKKKYKTKNKALMLSAILFAVLFIVGMVFRVWWVYYTGAIFTSMILAAGIYMEIHYLHQTTSFVKEELRSALSKGDRVSNDRSAELLSSLEFLSKENVEVYKMRIKEVLAMLANDTIGSGEDTQELIEKNQKIFTKIHTARHFLMGGLTTEK